MDSGDAVYDISLSIAIYIYRVRVNGSLDLRALEVCLYKILFTSRLLCTNQSSFDCPLPPALPAVLQYYCTSIAQYATTLRPPWCMPYTIQYW